MGVWEDGGAYDPSSGGLGTDTHRFVIANITVVW